MRVRLSLLVAFATVLGPISAGAQAERSGAALVLIEGTVYLNDRPVEKNAVPAAVPDSAVLRTTQGRAAVALKRGGWLLLDEGASVRVLGNGVYNFNRLEIITGSAIVASGTSAPLVDCENEIRLSSAGVFRFDAKPVDARGERLCQFRVYEGAAAVPLVTVTNALRAGQTMTCNRRCGDMVSTHEFSMSQLDGFDQWARRTHELLGHERRKYEND
jgi:hypothetical protein